MKNTSLDQKLIKGMNEALEYTEGEGNLTGARVHIPEHIDVQKIRRHLHLTQEAFAYRYGFILKTLRNWEQGIREPTGPARILLVLLQREPKTIEKILHNKS